MPKLSLASKGKLVSCDPRLITVLQEAIRYIDFAVIWGHRDKEFQDKAVAEGKSQTPWPTSKHNSMPSKAVDIALWPGLYERPKEDFYYLMGIVKGVACMLGISVRCGTDWYGDGETQDQRVHDLGHIELKED